jgi:DNA-directed RNA polymerase subunit RPC12/RpoP
VDTKSNVKVLEHGDCRNIHIACPDCGYSNWQMYIKANPPVTGQRKCSNCNALLQYTEIIEVK